jgi:hypothetical protein
MKTSNKILLALLVIIFTVPFLLATSLRSKMKRGEYKVVKNENKKGGNMRSGSFAAYKVVKVVAPSPHFLTCHLKLSDNMNYKYYQQTKEDSVMVFTSNDTLFIKYIAEKGIINQNERNDYSPTAILVTLPAFNNLVVDGAVVVIDSLPASLGNLSVILKNKGELKDGSKNREKEIGEVQQALSMKKNKDVQGSEISEAKVAIDSDDAGSSTIQKAGLEMLDVDIKYLLISRLLYRL